MYIQDLSIKNFRNYDNVHITFSPEVNFIIGNNGVGKTNILEAISVVSNIRTFRNISDVDIIKWHEDSYYSAVRVDGYHDSLFEVGCSVENEKIKKKLKIDGKEIKKASEYYGRLLTVILSPQDINIINSTPDYRRRFFDSVISKLDESYFDLLGDFRKVLASRNKILKDVRFNHKDIKELDVWDKLFCEKAGAIIQKRIHFIEKFNAVFQHFYSNIASEDEAPLIRYESSTKTYDIGQINDLLIQSRTKDLNFGSTTIGPQRDDFILENTSGNKFTNYASQGQRRTAAVTLKVSECIIIEEEKKSKAVILIDDIFSELDEIRRSKMIDLLRRGNQIIFTMVHFDPVQLNRFGNYKGFLIESNGNIRELSQPAG
jgi:DNA replication and repair protein RecF